MAWSRPVSLWLAPVLLLALGVFVILADGLGLESGLSNNLFDAYQRHAARPLSDMSFSDGVSVAVPVPVRVLELPVQPGAMSLANLAEHVTAAAPFDATLTAALGHDPQLDPAQG